GFISVSPPANMFDFSFLAPCPSSGLIVHGDQDKLVPEEAIMKLANKLNSQRDITVTVKSIKGADHFYKDRMDELVKHIDAYLDVASEPAAAKAAAAR
ncbi:MAG: alpha/beta hydrolase, partial [Alphaproteobacteria bacterium]